MNTFQHLERVSQASGWSMEKIVTAGPLERHYLTEELFRNNYEARLSCRIVWTRVGQE
jgi:hypothetical protein